MDRIADVYVNVRTRKISSAFTYKIPSGMNVVQGNRVYIPFGNTKVEGVVFAVRKTEEKDEIIVLKEIISVIDGDDWDEKQAVDFACWFSKHYLCTFMEAIRLLIPGGRSVKKNELLKKELFQTMLSFIANNAREEELLEKLKSRKAQKRLFEFLSNEKKISLKKLRELKFDAKCIKSAVEDGWAEKVQERILRDSYDTLNDAEQTGKVVLTAAQNIACQAVIDSIIAEKYAKFLLHGVTGSGKTQVYIECAKKAHAMGKQVLALVPEIGLTGQFVKRFKAVFGDEVAVIHSRLSVGERNDACNRLASGRASIILGVRSAVFAPFSDLGLIIVDEEHENAYRQTEMPFYHAVTVSEKLAEKFNATVLLGSATPRIETYHQAQNGVYKLLELAERIEGSALPQVKIVDMREELKQGRKTVISQDLRLALKETIEAGEQAVLLLNRRGHSTFVLCRDCGFVVKCEDCKIPMVYHIPEQNLRCHYCGTEQEVMVECPQCKGRRIKFFGTGTQKVEEELSELLPDARVIRMDQDTTKGKWGHEKILTAFASREFDILLGTQMVAKGHDIANVTLVGIISVDSSLQRADFYAAEQTFNLITQAAGRAGRGGKSGRVVLQTYNPESYVIKEGAKQNYKDFFAQEIELRRDLFYPPFSRMIKITCRGANESDVWRKADGIVNKLSEKVTYMGGKTEVLGPYAEYIKSFKGNYFVHVLLKTSEMEIMKECLTESGLVGKSDITIEVEPV